MNRSYASLIATAALVAAVSLSASAASPSVTPDQQLVAGLEDARSAARATLRGKAQLGRLAEAMRRARRAAPHAVGALESPAMQAALRASKHKQLRRLIALTSAALDSFGVPLEKDFPAFAVNRNFAHLPEFANYSGLSATVGEDISEVVIGPADRGTANVGERGAAATSSAGLPITLMSLAVISDPVGNFTSGWCELESGLITCVMRPAMPRDRIFTIAFGPKLSKGTNLLVKFRTPAGDRSYAVFATR